MELDITSLADTDAYQYSASQAEMGDQAGRLTWENNVRDAPDLLDTDEKREAAREHFLEYGAWSRKEIDSWTDRELNAITHQEIMASVRECPAILVGHSFYQRDGQWYWDHEDTPDLETGPFLTRSEAYQDANSNPPQRADTLSKIDWLEYKGDAEAGLISSRLHKGDDGRFYFYLGV